MTSDDQQPQEQPTPDGIEYYWCVNCGHNGRFPFRRLIKQNCQECNYDALTPYEKDEILADEHLTFKFRDVLK